MLRGHRSCFRVMGMSRSSQPQGLNLLSTAWDALPAVPLIADHQASAERPPLQRRLPVPLLSPRLVSGVAHYSWHISSSVIVCLLFTSCPNPRQTARPMVSSALFLSWVWYYSTASDTKRAAQEVFLKWVNSNEGISSQGQQTKCGLEVKRCWAWKPFPKKHFAPWSLWSYFSLCVLSFSPTINDSMKGNFCSGILPSVKVLSCRSMVSILSVYQNVLKVLPGGSNVYPEPLVWPPREQAEWARNSSKQVSWMRCLGAQTLRESTVCRAQVWAQMGVFSTDLGSSKHLWHSARAENGMMETGQLYPRATQCFSS